MRSNTQKETEYTKERLFSYALWYTGKYRVSRARILEKMRWKSSNEKDITEVLTEIEPYHSDGTEIRSFIDSCLLRSKPLQYVKSSLRKKKFQLVDIETILLEFQGFDDYTNFEASIEKRISHLIEKGNWPQAIKSDLTQKYPQFANRIHNRCKDFDEMDLLEHGPYSKKFSWDMYSDIPKEIKKIQDTLLRKWFSYSSIRIFVKKIWSKIQSDSIE